MDRNLVARGHRKLVAASILYLFWGALCLFALILFVINEPGDLLIFRLIFGLASAYYLIFGVLVLKSTIKIGKLLKQDKDISVGVAAIARHLQKTMIAAVYTGFGVLLVFAVIQHMLVVNAVKYDFSYLLR